MEETHDTSGAASDDVLRPAPGVTIAPDALRLTYVRSRGPGGQSVNKVSTCAELRVQLAAIVGLTERATERLRRLAGQRLTRDDDLILRCDTYRSQGRNRRACIDRLTALVAEAAPEPKVRRPTRPSRAAVRRRLEAKRRRGERKRTRRDPRDD